MEKPEPAGVSRRALLGVAGGAAIGAVLTGASSAQAANGDPLIVGAENHGDTTYLFGDSSPVLFLRGAGDDGMLNVFNTAPDTGYAILAQGGDTAIQAAGDRQGIYAVGRDVGGFFGDGGHGVGVQAQGGRVGVSGVSANGVGVKAQAGKAGVALSVKGRSQFTTAGMTTIPEGASSAVVTSPIPLSDGSLILATPQTAGGVIASASKNIAAGTFTLTLMKPAGQPVDVAWFVIG